MIRKELKHGKYVRAQLLGSDGSVTQTQPWYLSGVPADFPLTVRGGSVVQVRFKGGQAVEITGLR